MTELADPGRERPAERRVMLMGGLLILATVFVVGSLLYMLFR